MKYTYIPPIEKGFRELRMSKKDHNRIFKNRQLNWKCSYKYYYDGIVGLIEKDKYKNVKLSLWDDQETLRKKGVIFASIDYVVLDTQNLPDGVTYD